MPYQICKSFEIESAHMLSKHKGNCRFPHGHSRKVEFILEADDLDVNEMVCDFKLARVLIEKELNKFDHAICMNTQDPAFTEMKERYGERVIEFINADPTTEKMAHDIGEAFIKNLAEYTGTDYVLGKSVRLLSVRVWETSSSWAQWSP